MELGLRPLRTLPDCCCFLWGGPRRLVCKWRKTTKNKKRTQGWDQLPKMWWRNIAEMQLTGPAGKQEGARPSLPSCVLLSSWGSILTEPIRQRKMYSGEPQPRDHRPAQEGGLGAETLAHSLAQGTLSAPPRPFYNWESEIQSMQESGLGPHITVVQLGLAGTGM